MTQTFHYVRNLSENNSIHDKFFKRRKSFQCKLHKYIQAHKEQKRGRERETYIIFFFKFNLNKPKTYLNSLYALPTIEQLCNVSIILFQFSLFAFTILLLLLLLLLLFFFLLIIILLPIFTLLVVILRSYFILRSNRKRVIN